MIPDHQHVPTMPKWDVDAVPSASATCQVGWKP